MNKQLLALCQELTNDIKTAYENGTSLDEAEKLAAKFLYAQLQITAELQTADLDSRMRKSGVKAIRAAVYMKEATKSDKKPSDTFLQNLVDMDEMVQGEQNRFDSSEVYKDELYNYFSIFKEAHIYFRGISKGRFE